MENKKEAIIYKNHISKSIYVSTFIQIIYAIGSLLYINDALLNSGTKHYLYGSIFFFIGADVEKYMQIYAKHI